MRIVKYCVSLFLTILAGLSFAAGGYRGGGGRYGRPIDSTEGASPGLIIFAFIVIAIVTGIVLYAWYTKDEPQEY